MDRPLINSWIELMINYYAYILRICLLYNIRDKRYM